jgi:adenylate kinase family enzyme
MCRLLHTILPTPNCPRAMCRKSSVLFFLCLILNSNLNSNSGAKQLAHLPNSKNMSKEHRIVVIGTSGSGKTTLARQLAQKLGVPHIEMDSLHWEANWKEAEPEVFRARVASATSAPQWTIDGGYSRVRPLVWGRANMVVWLDYPRHVVMRRLIWRTVRRIVGKKELWNGNRESLRKAFFSKDSIIVWAWTTHARNQQKFSEALHQPEYSHIEFVRLRSPRITAHWFNLFTQKKF